MLNGFDPKLASRMKPIANEDLTWRPLEWHEGMKPMYEHAARYPWLPVECDPPRSPMAPSSLIPEVPTPVRRKVGCLG